MADSLTNICLPLPLTVVNKANTSAVRDQYLVNLLQGALPSSDTKSIGDELKKTFTFNKYRTKHAPRKPKRAKFLTTRKRILLGLNKLPSTLKYSEMLPLNQLWLDYMRQMLGVKDFSDLPTGPMEANWDSVGQQLLKADFHGALISVVRSKCPSLVGIRGIILQDTKNSFRVLGEDSIARTIPKETAVFELHMRDTTLRLFGRELCVRPAERSVRKFKTAHIADL